MLFPGFNVTIYNFTSNQYRKQKNDIVENITDEITMQNVKAGKSYLVDENSDGTKDYSIADPNFNFLI